MDQQTTFTFRPAPPAPALAEVSRLVSWLQDNPGFHTAAILSRMLNLSDRKLRQLAQASDGIIISGPGSPGYCHLDHCPTESLRHISRTLFSQGKAMIRRSFRMRRQAHSKIA